MNRFELFLFLIVAFVAVILTIRSRWFDRLIDWTFKGDKPVQPPTTPSDSNPDSKP